MLKDNKTTVKSIHLENARTDNVEIISILISVGDRVQKGDIIATYSYSDRGMFGGATEERVKISSPLFGMVASIHINLGDKVSNDDLLVKLIEPIQRYCVVLGRTLSELTEKVNYKMDEFWTPQGSPFKGMEKSEGRDKEVRTGSVPLSANYVETNIWCQAMVYTKE